MKFPGHSNFKILVIVVNSNVERVKFFNTIRSFLIFFDYPTFWILDLNVI